MPPLISFIISRLAIGFALGAVTGLAIWWVGFSAQFSEGASGHWIAQLLFGSCPMRWCKCRRGHRALRQGREDQRATAGKLMIGSSLILPMVSTVM